MSQKQSAGPSNSQTVPLLTAVLGADPNLSQGGGNTSIVASALLPDTGPLGTIADVVEHPSHNGQISVYVVKEGDTLSQIAEMYGVSVNTIRWANDLPKSGLVKPGEHLTILPISGVRHQVIKGDTIGKIAKQYGADAEEIAAFNGLELAASLAVGQTIIVPDGEIAPTVAPVKPAPGGGSQPVESGYYLRPIAGGRKTQGLHGYNGIDLATAHGAEIYAAAAGTVIVSKEGGWNGGYGNYIVIRHDNGTQTLYAHNSRNLVTAGTPVNRGQVIGYVGSTGRSSGAHLHFEVRGAKNPF